MTMCLHFKGRTTVSGFRKIQDIHYGYPDVCDWYIFVTVERPLPPHNCNWRRYFRIQGRRGKYELDITGYLKWVSFFGGVVFYSDAVVVTILLSNEHKQLKYKKNTMNYLFKETVG